MVEYTLFMKLWCAWFIWIFLWVIYVTMPFRCCSTMDCRVLNS